MPAPSTGKRCASLRRAGRIARSSIDETYLVASGLWDPRGPIDQRKIAAFARRKPWVQIPLGPLSGVLCQASTALPAERVGGAGGLSAGRTCERNAAPATPAKRVVLRKGDAAIGAAPLSAGSTAGFAARSLQRRIAVPLRRTGFHEDVILPQSAQRRSRDSEASDKRRVGRSDPELSGIPPSDGDVTANASGDAA